VLRRRAAGESIETIRTDLIIPAGKRKGHNPSLASIYRAPPNTTRPRPTPRPSNRPTPTSQPCTQPDDTRHAGTNQAERSGSDLTPRRGPHITAVQVHISWIFRQDYWHPCGSGSRPGPGPDPPGHTASLSSSLFLRRDCQPVAGFYTPINQICAASASGPERSTHRGKPVGQQARRHAAEKVRA
jgi:hypothetical protein